MSGLAMMAHLLLERLSISRVERVPEPDLVMEDPAQNAAFMAAGREDGILAFSYFFHALQTTRVIRPGERVLDLACGPANQLVQIARLNPQASFLGVDASMNMLERARDTLRRCEVDNVELMQADMTDLMGLAAESFDVLTCTMSLHHLPGLADLHATMQEAKRVLRPGGGMYWVDFARLKRVAAQRHFAFDRKESQPELFTLDYLHSLRAAFSFEQLRTASAACAHALRYETTALVPFMVVMRSEDRSRADEAVQALARRMYAAMTATQRRDFWNFARWFRLGGFALPLALER